jgi:branched-subunit amino acid transport protein
MRFFVLLTILLNVLTAPWGLAAETATTGAALALALLVAIGTLLLKMLMFLPVAILSALVFSQVFLLQGTTLSSNGLRLLAASFAALVA